MGSRRCQRVPQQLKRQLRSQGRCLWPPCLLVVATFRPSPRRQREASSARRLHLYSHRHFLLQIQRCRASQLGRSLLWLTCSWHRHCPCKRRATVG